MNGGNVMEEKKYYIVSTKCGHVGRNKYIMVDFAIKAETAKDAAQIAKRLPRVKKHWKDVVSKVKEVTREVFYEQILENNKDNYLKSRCIQDQRQMCQHIEERVQCREFTNNEIDLWEQRGRRLQFQMKKRRLLGY